MSDVNFTNSHSSRLYVAYMRRDWGCLSDCGDRWDVLGWIVLDPGQSQSRPNPTDNRWFYYYAEADDGTTWSGEYPAEVTDAAFEKCTCLGVVTSSGGSPYYQVGMAVVDLDQFGGVNFR
jgi:hypothetical protein